MKVNCRNCAYFKITWDVKLPYGCSVMEFKARQLPSVEVFEASGRECLKFRYKGKPVYRKVDRRF